MAQINIDRPNEFLNGRRPYQIYIDNKQVGTIANGENKSFEVEQGEHSVVVKNSFFMGSSIILTTVKSDETKRYKVSGINGAIWLVGIVLACFGIEYAIQPFFNIDQYIYIVFPGIFLLYFLLIGKKRHLSLIIE